MRPSSGAVTVGDGASLQYVECGRLHDDNNFTVVEGLQFDLYAAVAAAKRGVSSVIDFDAATGSNKSYL